MKVSTAGFVVSGKSTLAEKIIKSNNKKENRQLQNKMHEIVYFELTGKTMQKHRKAMARKIVKK